MEGIKSYFKNKCDKEVTDCTIHNTISRRCFHCGYGKVLTGRAVLVPIKYDDSDDLNSEESVEEESVDFVYFTGCLSYDDEMDYE